MILKQNFEQMRQPTHLFFLSKNQGNFGMQKVKMMVVAGGLIASSAAAILNSCEKPQASYSAQNEALGGAATYKGPQKIIKIEVTSEVHNDDYKRKEYKHWIDADEDCQNARNEVLIEESQGTLSYSKDGCKVTQGKWICPYTGQEFHLPKEVDIDHFVPLKEAHVSGAWAWDSDKKQAYANFLEDPMSLVAVKKEANRDKSDQDPAEWMPPRKQEKCPYVEQWIQVKSKWELSMNQEEFDFVQSTLLACKSQLKLVAK